MGLSHCPTLVTPYDSTQPDRHGYHKNNVIKHNTS